MTMEDLLRETFGWSGRFLTQQVHLLHYLRAEQSYPLSEVQLVDWSSSGSRSFCVGTSAHRVHRVGFDQLRSPSSFLVSDVRGRSQQPGSFSLGSGGLDRCLNGCPGAERAERLLQRLAPGGRLLLSGENELLNSGSYRAFRRSLVDSGELEFVVHDAQGGAVFGVNRGDVERRAGRVFLADAGRLSLLGVLDGLAGRSVSSVGGRWVTREEIVENEGVLISGRYLAQEARAEPLGDAEALQRLEALIQRRDQAEAVAMASLRAAFDG